MSLRAFQCQKKGPIMGWAVNASLLPISEQFEFLSIPLQNITKSPMLIQIKKHFASSVRLFFPSFYFFELGKGAFHPLGGTCSSLLLDVLIAAWPAARWDFTPRFAVRLLPCAMGSKLLSIFLAGPGVSCSLWDEPELSVVKTAACPRLQVLWSQNGLHWRGC